MALFCHLPFTFFHIYSFYTLSFSRLLFSTYFCGFCYSQPCEFCCFLKSRFIKVESEKFYREMERNRVKWRKILEELY